MEINILEESKNKLVIEIVGESHALCNALKSELSKNKKVKLTGYSVDHPLVGVPKLIIETDSADPKQLLADAAKAVKKDSEAFLKAFNKVAK